MPSDRVWRTLARLASLIGVLWALVALATLGYFVSLGVQIVRHG